jgi:hypothetical protein
MAGEPKQREARLHKVREAMKQEQAQARTLRDRAPILEEEVRDLRVQQRRVEEHRKMLIEAERQMIRRWARPRSMLLVGWMLVILGVTAAASWTAADHLFPPQVAASVTLAAGNPGAPADRLALWQHWHQTMLYDSQFHAEVAERMGDRLLEPLRSPSAVSQLIVEDLSVDGATPGTLVLSLNRPRVEEAVLLLDVIAVSLADSARLRQHEREDGLSTVIREGSDDPEHDTYAAASPVPIRDERLLYGGGIFGASLLVSLMAAIAVASWLRRKRPVLRESELSALEAAYCEAGPADARSLKPLM